jgi:hypothetical protein
VKKYTDTLLLHPTDVRIEKGDGGSKHKFCKTCKCKHAYGKHVDADAQTKKIKAHVAKITVRECCDRLLQADIKLTPVNGGRNALSARRSTGLCARCPRGHVSDVERLTTLSVKGEQTRPMQSSRIRQPRQTHVTSPRGRRDAWQQQ